MSEDRPFALNCQLETAVTQCSRAVDIANLAVLTATDHDHGMAPERNMLNVIIVCFLHWFSESLRTAKSCGLLLRR